MVATFIQRQAMKKLKTFFTLLVSALLLSCAHSKKIGQPVESNTILIFPDGVKTKTSAEVAAALLRTKYSKQLSVDSATIQNIRLYQFIDKWMYTPYLWGGTTEKGIDCSAFIQTLLADVYTIAIPRTSVQQFFTERIEPFASTDYLSEGDLVFFRTLKNTYVSHVGLYLQNNRFVNASSSKGVSIANLNDPYWRKKFVAAGRVRTTKSPQDAAAKFIRN